MDVCNLKLYSPRRLILSLTEHGCFNWLPDIPFLRLKFYLCMGEKLNLKSPVTFSEKLQWLKLYDRNPRYIDLVDKCAVKEYVASIIGQEYLIPTIQVFESEKEIDLSALPNRFVLKGTHDSGSVVLCRDISSFDITAARKKLKKALQRSGFQFGREWPYKNVRPRIIAEQYLDSADGDLPDYKFHCFNGKVKLILVCKDRFRESGITEDFFDEKWNHLPVKRPNSPSSRMPIEKPEKLEEMISLAEKLSENIPFLRVDFYYANGEIYFGELTFFPASGFSKFEPEEWDEILGTWLELPT